MQRQACVFFGLIVLLAPSAIAQTIAPLRLGANVNESAQRLDPDLLVESETQWVRAFFPASQFIAGSRDVTTDDRFQHFKSLADQGYSLLLTIKWDLKNADWNVPAAGSATEELWLDFVDEIFEEMDGRISIFATVNELFVDTKNADLQPDSNDVIPMARFLQAVTQRVRSQGYVDPYGAPVPIYVGGFTRVDLSSNQNAPAVTAIIDWANNDPDVTGVNFHMHHNTISQFQTALTFMRNAVPTKPFIVTEYSLVWRYKDNLGAPVGATQAGVNFLSSHELDPDLLVYEYINLALANPVPESEWHEFLASQSWYDQNFLWTTASMMDSSGVTVATYAFVQGASGGFGPITTDTTPWLLNPIFVPGVAVSPDPTREAHQLGFFDSYVAWNSLISYVWDGGATPGDNTLSNPLNWADDAAPYFPSEPAIVFGGTVGLNPVNDVRRRTVQSMTFDFTAGAFDLSGELFGINELLSNASSEPQTISAAVQSNGATIDAAFADLSLASLFTSLGTNTTLNAGGVASLDDSQRYVLTIDALSGSGDVDCTGTGQIDLLGDNASFSGALTTTPGGSVVIRAAHGSSLGSVSAGTTIEWGGYQALELSGDIALSEPLILTGRYAEDDIASAIINVSGDNVLAGPITLLDGDSASRTGLNFRVDAGSLTVAQAPILGIDHEIVGQTPDPLALRLRGAGRMTLQAPLRDDDDSADIMSVYVGGSSTLELDGTLNTYSGATRVAQNATLDLDGGIPNTAAITLESLNTVVDATDIGGLVLGAGQTLSGNGTVLGGVTAGSGSTLSPGLSAGILNIDGPLTLENGCTLDLEVGQASDRVMVNGLLSGPGTNSGGITLQVGTAIPVYSGTNTRVIQAAAIQNLTPDDFTIVTPPELANVINGVSVQVTANQVQLSFNVIDQPQQVLVIASNGGFDVELYLVQAGVWQYQREFITTGGPRGFVQDPVTGDIWTTEVDSDGDTLRYNNAGDLLEIVGTTGDEYAQRVEFLELDAQGNVYLGTQPAVTAANQQIYKYDVNTHTWSTIVPPTDGVNYAFGGNLRDLEIVGDRLFVADKDNARIVEFNTTTGAFVQVFDDTDLPQVSAITYDPVSDQLYVSCNIDNSSSRADDVKAYGGIAGRDGLAPTSETIVFQTFGDVNEDRNIHGILVLDGDVYISSQGTSATVDGIYRIENPGPSATTTLVAAGNRTETTVMNVVNVLTASDMDLNADGDVDSDDALVLMGCLSGADQLLPPAGCSLAEFQAADADADGDVDMADVEQFNLAFGL